MALDIWNQSRRDGKS